MAEKRKSTRILSGIIAVVAIIAFAYLSRWNYYRTMTIHHLLTENKQLKQSISNLTQEEQIGYAKVILQEKKNGKLLTTIRFVETARDDKLKKILEKEYTVAGDIVHFDALIVKFRDKMVMNGKAKSLYLWRRVYGETMKPEEGFLIEQPGTEPERYNGLLTALPVVQKQLFWTSIWELANDPEKLKKYDIEAVYGNVVYTKLKKGLIYVFKINAAGQVTPEVVPEM